MAKKIMLISGHGAGDSGAVATYNGVKYQEAVETVALVRKIAADLNGYDVDVSVYPCERDAYQDYKNGTLTLGKSDLLIEIHFNAFKFDSGNGQPKGTEVFYRPNAVNGAKEAAEQLSAAIAKTLNIPNRGAKQGNYAVIGTANAQGIPAVLVEVCFIDDFDDFNIYLTRRDAVSAVIARTACDLLGVGKKAEKPSVDTETPSDWAKDACNWCVKHGLFEGSDGRFNWQKPLTRQDAAVIMQRAFRKFADAIEKALKEGGA